MMMTNSDPSPLSEEVSGFGSPIKGPDVPANVSAFQKLFSTPPKTGQWIPWIEKLLSDVPAVELVENNNHVVALCEQAEEVFKVEPNRLTLNVEEADDLVLVGDVHGQFKDLTQHVLIHQLKAKQAGKKDFKFLFLGDYVDRGPMSVEVLLLLLALKVEYPSMIYMLRGNHEEFQTCRIYGFSYECQTKFKEPRIFSKFNEVFMALPLAAVVTTKAGSLFCCHGGLSPPLSSPQAVDFVNRLEYEGGLDESGEVVDGLLWSDPCDSGSFRQNARGCGFLFGPDVTKSFLETNSLSLIVRAHQLAMAGYSWEHDNKVLTVFSAPNYCGINNNKGAILVMHGTDTDYKSLDLRAYDAVTDAPPLFTSASPSSKPTPDAARLQGGYFEEEEEEVPVTNNNAASAE